MNSRRNISENPHKIMIVDDDPLVVHALERLLFVKNYLFFSVNSGEKALEEVKAIKPDLILLDIFMEGMSGYEVCSQLKEDRKLKHIPVIFLTSNTTSNDIVKGFRTGAVDYIVKPFKSEELIARLDTHLELKTIREEIKMMNLVRTKFFSLFTNNLRDLFIGVKGVTGFLYDEVNKPSVDETEVKNLSKILLDDNDKIFALLNNIDQWSAIELGNYDFNISLFSVPDVIEKVISEFAGQINKKNIVIDFQNKNASVIKNAKNALEDAFRIVLSNALKYSYTKGKILVRTERKANKMELLVRDEGVGMDNEVIENIFRLDTPHPKTIGTEKEKGIGLGLIICRALINQMDSQIDILSARNKGTTVKLLISDLENTK
ncbi:MAG: response regulator [Bacteroidales bacterium]